VLLTSSCSPPTDVVIAVVLLQGVVANATAVVNTKIIVSVKIVPAVVFVARKVSRDIFLLFFSVFILCAFYIKDKVKKSYTNQEKVLSVLQKQSLSRMRLCYYCLEISLRA
jgi:hypothetical protein